MRKTGLLLLLISGYLISDGQTLRKVPIEKSGCSVYAYCTLQFEKDYSDDSSIVYMAECASGDVVYGVICVKLSEVADDISRAEESMVNYLNYLKTSFNIVQSTGYGRGHHLNGKEDTRGVLDYWEDAKKRNWKIKAWTDGKFIGVLYGYSGKELPEQKLNVFLDSMRFPGM